MATGSGLVAVVVEASGGGAPSAASAVFRLFIIMYGALFFSTSAFAAHLGGCLALVTFALAQTQTSSGQVAHLAVLLGGTMVATGTVVCLLTRRLTDLSTHDPLTGLCNEAVDDALDADTREDLLRMNCRDFT